jgi:hypothetical protein
MFEKSEALDYAFNGLVSSILEDSANDGLECRSNHLGCCVIRSTCYKDASFDAYIVPSTRQGIITQDLFANGGPASRGLRPT